MSLLERIRQRSVTVGVVGLGYVGLPLAAAFAEALARGTGRVVGFDIDPAKIEALGAGRSYIRHLGEDFAAKLMGTGRFAATADFSRLAECDAILICVPTPLGKHLEPDLSYVERTADEIAERLRPGQLIVLESTTYPRTTREVILPRLRREGGAGGAAGGLSCGHDDGFYLAFSPEREDPGRKDVSNIEVPKLIGGIDAASGEVAAALYALAFKRIVRVSTAEVAEAAKLLENIYRSVNIALVNEMKIVLGAMGIDIWEVIEAAKTKPFGFQAFYPGPGLGGHCIPIDPYYLTWKAREVGLSTRFIELAGEVNHAMPEYVVERIAGALNERGKPVKGSRVLVLGLAYKPDIDDVRESPSFVIIEKLQDRGAVVDYSDPHVPATHRMRKHDLQMSSVAISPAMLASYDAVVVSTHHAAFDWQMVADHGKLVIDTRNALRDVRGGREHIVMA